MSGNSLTSRLPWQDRWNQPTLLQLLDPLKIQHRRLFEQLMEELVDFEEVDQVIHWYGSAWNWTIQYRLHDPSLAEPHTLVYLVPRVENPIIVIPLSDEIIEQLPLKRLNRFIRDGIKNAKRAVAIHWATWTPNSKAEVTFLTDLLRRKCKLLLAPADKSAVETEPADALVDARPAKAGKSAKTSKRSTKAASESAEAEVEAEAEVKAPAPAQKAGRGSKAGKASAPVVTVKSKAKAAAMAEPAPKGKAVTLSAGPAAKKPASAGKAATASSKAAASTKAVKTVKLARPTAKSAAASTEKAKVTPAAASKTAKGKSSGKAVPQASAKAGGKSATARTPAKSSARPAMKSAVKPAAKSAAKPAAKVVKAAKPAPKADKSARSAKPVSKGKTKLASAGRKK